MSRPARRWRWGWGVLLAWALPAALGVAFARGWLELPDRWNPWAPLWPQEAPNALTRFKLQRLDGDPLACAAALRATSLTFTPMPDRVVDGGCGWRDAVRVSALPARLGAPVVLSCPAALSLSMWERHTLQPLARASFGTGVAAIEHFGSYACRDIGGGRSDEGRERRSEHATANAIDVAAFVLADGRSISVARDWRSSEADPRGRFLREVHDGACAWWNVVLGPEYNAAHGNHFHLDRGRYRACR
jgi:hypothetical protein